MNTEYVWSQDINTQNLLNNGVKQTSVLDSSGSAISLYAITTSGPNASEHFYIATEIALTKITREKENGETVRQVPLVLQHVFGQDITAAPYGTKASYAVTCMSNGSVGSALRQNRQWEYPQLRNGKIGVTINGKAHTL